jgi:pyruvate formate lyase activating enzyme
MQGTVVNIQRMSTEDGPGLRTTVFLKGCSLACAWCHNPEAMCARPELVWFSSRCGGLGECLQACGEDALTRRDGEIIIDRERCTSCGDCVRACPSAALELLGTTWEAGDLVTELLKDRSFFQRSGGGVTISGGEPGMQHRFVVELLDGCSAAGVATAVDTAGLVGTQALLDMAGRADLALYDLKHIDPQRHRCLTGHTNERILANLEALAERMRVERRPAELWIRTPLVPGATLERASIEGIGAFLASRLEDVVTRWELCAFNNLATDKYRRLGLDWPWRGAPLLTRTELEEAAAWARDSGVDPAIVVATGAVRAADTAPAGQGDHAVDTARRPQSAAAEEIASCRS